MARICMLRLASADVIYDSRVLREAEALGKHHEVVVLDILEGKSRKKETIKNFKVERIKIFTKKLQKNFFFWGIKYCEYLLRTSIKAAFKKADVYHAHDLHTLIPAYIAAKINKTKVVYDSHELYTETLDMNGRMRKIWRFIEKILITRVDKVIAANESRAQIMKNEYGITEFPAVLMNCPLTESPCPTKKLVEYLEQMGVKNKKIVLYQGGLSAGRGLEEVVMSAQYLREDIVIVFMGYGELRDKLMMLSKDARFENKIFFHNAVASKELHSYTSSADLGIVIYQNTCKNNYYCAPNKLFEYAMAGIPVVGCDFPEISKIVSKYEIGKLFDPEDTKSIAKAINYIFDDEQRYNQMKRNTQLVRDIYNWENEEKKLLSLYKKLNLNF